MDDEQLGTLEDLQGFLDGTVTMNLTLAEDERYTFIARTVKRIGYAQRSKLCRPATTARSIRCCRFVRNLYAKSLHKHMWARRALTLQNHF